MIEKVYIFSLNIGSHMSVNIARIVAVHFIDQVVRNEKERGYFVGLPKNNEDIFDSMQCGKY